MTYLEARNEPQNRSGETEGNGTLNPRRGHHGFCTVYTPVLCALRTVNWMPSSITCSVQFSAGFHHSIIISTNHHDHTSSHHESPSHLSPPRISTPISGLRLFGASSSFPSLSSLQSTAVTANANAAETGLPRPPSFPGVLWRKVFEPICFQVQVLGLAFALDPNSGYILLRRRGPSLKALLASVLACSLPSAWSCC